MMDVQGGIKITYKTKAEKKASMVEAPAKLTNTSKEGSVGSSKARAIRTNGKTAKEASTEEIKAEAGAGGT